MRSLLDQFADGGKGMGAIDQERSNGPAGADERRSEVARARVSVDRELIGGARAADVLDPEAVLVGPEARVQRGAWRQPQHHAPRPSSLTARGLPVRPGKVPAQHVVI